MPTFGGSRETRIEIFKNTTDNKLAYYDFVNKLQVLARIMTLVIDLFSETALVIDSKMY